MKKETVARVEVVQVYLGVVLVGVGAGMYSLPLGLVVGGVLLVLLGILGSK